MNKEEILPHGDFKQLDESLWVLEGKLPYYNPLPRTMTVYRMKDKGLWIHSAIALNEETFKKLESFGTPKYVVVPNSMHRLDAHFYKERYPNIQVVCPEAALKKVEEAIHVDKTCEEAFAKNEIEVLAIPGVKDVELAFELPLTFGKALIMTDLLVNVPKVNGLGGFLLKALGRIGYFRTPPLTKLIFVEKKNEFKKWLLELSQDTDLRIITVAHGRPVLNGVSALLKKAAAQI